MSSAGYTIKDVEKVAKLDGKVKHVKESLLTAPGENFFGLVLRLDFEVEKNEHLEKVSVVAKCIPPRVLRGPGPGPGIHGNGMKNEIKWYTEIVPLLKSFGKENGIIIDCYPEYRGSRYSLDASKKDPDGDSVLLLENLITQGYLNNDRYIGCDFNTTKATLKTLAIFHALPIAIKIKKPELFQGLKNFLETGRLHPPQLSGGQTKPQAPPMFKKAGQSIFEEVVKIPDFGPYIAKIKPLFEKPMGPHTFYKIAKEPWNTVSHNDFWINNIMVKYENEKPVVKLVDFQMCSYESFAKDLIFFLLTSVRNDVIKEHMDDLLRFYYDEFTSVLRKTNTDLELTYKEYLQEVSDTAVEIGVRHTIFFSTFVFGEKGKGIDENEQINPEEHLTALLKYISENRKKKLILIVSEACKRNWL